MLLADVLIHLLTKHLISKITQLMNETKQTKKNNNKYLKYK